MKQACDIDMRYAPILCSENKVVDLFLRWSVLMVDNPIWIPVSDLLQVDYAIKLILTNAII